jgi:hypothetical protein
MVTETNMMKDDNVDIEELELAGDTLKNKSVH